jgi:hypothetical protein
MENHQAELEARKKLVMEKKWCLMAELPGYKEWAEQYIGLERIIPNLGDYHVLVHPDEFSRPLDWIFEREYRGWLADFAERGGKRRDLDDYKKA